MKFLSSKGLKSEVVALRRELHILRLHMGMVTDGTWRWWPRKNREEYSDQFWWMFGYDPSTKTDSPEEWQKIIHPDDLIRALEAYEAHVDERRLPYHLPVRYLCFDGSWKWVICRGQAIFDDKGEVDVILGAHWDINAFKHAEIELLQANRELEKRLADMTRVRPMQSSLGPILEEMRRIEDKEHGAP